MLTTFSLLFQTTGNAQSVPCPESSKANAYILGGVECASWLTIGKTGRIPKFLGKALCWYSSSKNNFNYIWVYIFHVFSTWEWHGGRKKNHPDIPTWHNQRKGNVLVFVHWTQSRISWEEFQLRSCLDQVDLWTCLWETVLIVNWYRQICTIVCGTNPYTGLLNKHERRKRARTSADNKDLCA